MYAVRLSLPPLFLSFSLVSRMKSDPNSDARTATLPVRQTTTHISHAVHSTGWGGAGNIYSGDEMLAMPRRLREPLLCAKPAVGRHSVEHDEYESMGRSEVGNIVHDTGKE
ncbi:hypothetical protein BDN70DRAFT_888930, partial [Pholiota conissans]